MLAFFLKIMRQKCGSYVCVQLLQTLNILFENIRNETSLCKSMTNYNSTTHITLTQYYFRWPVQSPVSTLVYDSLFDIFRLPPFQQSCQLNHSPQVWLFRWRSHGLLYFLLEDPLPQTKFSHNTFFLQWGKLMKN